MPDRGTLGGWRGGVLVAVTYVYFLIFAQFAFLSRLTELSLAATGLKAVMGAMATGGILFSLLSPRLDLIPSPQHRLRIAFFGCGVAALTCLLPLGLIGAAAVAFLIGAALGLLTVTLVTHLRASAGDRNPILMVGLGTGVGYFLCNVPPLFTATPKIQALVAAVLCLIGMALSSPQSETSAQPATPSPPNLSFPRALTTFAALVWLDSAAFFIIQHSPALKAGTWLGSAHLWTNACLHLGAAACASWLLQRWHSGTVLAAAFLALGFACVLLQSPALALPASLFYPIGVSLYSVTLVAYPSFLTAASTTRERGIQAGWIYAVAGWLGSALGIGMGQNLGHVPTTFIAVGGAVVLLPVFVHLGRVRTRELAVSGFTLAAAFGLYRFLPAPSGTLRMSAIDRGRRIYIGEGCIHCHSQYVRPDSPDVLMWGPVETVAELRTQQPPLIGNRRQGPDLTQVGTRRSVFWLKAHLIDPPEVSGDSIMPSFAFLFHDQRGDDLVSYLASLQSGDMQHRVDEEQAWNPSAEAISHADAPQGKALYEHQCVNCHEANGRARRQYQEQFSHPPESLLTGRFARLPSNQPALDRYRQLARITKFGIHGTDMPGHEYLSDQQIASLSLFLLQGSPDVHHNP